MIQIPSVRFINDFKNLQNNHSEKFLSIIEDIQGQIE